MKKSEFLETLAPLFPEELTTEQVAALTPHFQKAVNDLPQCNKCGGFFEQRNWSTSVDVRWGYQSTGKDMEQDKWKLCRSCGDDFKKNYSPICSLCIRPIVDVMAELYSRNPHCTFYGNFKGALEYYQTSDHCGLEFATIAGRIACEICYENYISDFKIPIQAGEYHPWDGNFIGKEGEQRKNRIEEAFSWHCNGDSLSTMSDTWLTFDETVAIRAMKDAAQRAIKLNFRRSDPGMLAVHLKADPDYQDTAVIHTGTDAYIRIPVGYLEEVAKIDGKKLDMMKPAIYDQGKMIGFGELTLPTVRIIIDCPQTKKD